MYRHPAPVWHAGRAQTHGAGAGRLGDLAPGGTRASHRAQEDGTRMARQVGVIPLRNSCEHFLQPFYV